MVGAVSELQGEVENTALEVGAGWCRVVCIIGMCITVCGTGQQ